MNSFLHKIVERVRSFAYVAVHKTKDLIGKVKLRSRKRLDYKQVNAAHGRRFPSWRQLRHIGRTFTDLDRAVVRFASAVIVVCLLVIGYNNIFRKITYFPANGGEFTEGIVGAPLYINPIFAQTNDVDLDLSSLLFNGLFKYDDTLELVPDLATSYQVSDDQKVYTVSLKKGVTWHDGRPLTAGDVVFTLQSILDENYKSPLYRSFAGVTVAKKDDYTVEFTLTEPYAAFLHLLTFGVIPQHLWYNIAPVTAKLSNLNQKPVGTGPYKLKSLVKESSGIIRSYTLEKNKDYHGKVPYIDRITFKFYPDYQTALDALLNKNVDSLAFLPNDQYTKVAGKKRIVTHTIPLSQLTGIFFNTDKSEVLKDKVVRQALAYGTDKQAIIDQILKGLGEVATGPILPGFIGYADTAKYSYNPQKGAQMLLDAGWKLDGETLKKKDLPLNITLTVVNQGEFPAVAEALRQQWRQIGVNVTVETVDKTQVEKDTIIPRNYQALIYGEAIGYDPDPYPYWHSSQRVNPGVNLSSYANRKVDDLLEQARTTADVQARADKYTAFQGIISEDVPALFLYSPSYTYPVSGDIKGIGVTRIATPSDRFIGIENWYIKTKRSLQ